MLKVYDITYKYLHKQYLMELRVLKSIKESKFKEGLTEYIDTGETKEELTQGRIKKK